MRFLLILLWLPAAVFSQPDTLWTRSYGTAAVEWGHGVAVASNGDHLFAGRVNVNGDKLNVIRADAAGDQIWSRSYGQPNNEVGRAIAEAPDGTILVATSMGTVGSSDIWIVRLSATGDSLWSRRLFDTSNEIPTGMIVNSDGSFLVCGFRGGSSESFRALVVRFNANGDTVWSRTYSGPAGSSGATARSISRVGDAGYFVTGGVTPTGASLTDFYALRLDADGNVLWQQNYGDPARMEIAVGGGSIGDDYLLGGQASVTSGVDFRALKIGPTGNQIWTRTYATDRSETATGAAIATDLGIVIGGYQNNPNTQDDVFLLKYSAFGSLAWTKVIGGSQNDWCENIAVSNDGGVVTVGWSRSFTHGETDFYGVRLAGLSGVTGFITHRISGLPMAGVRVSALGQFGSVTSDRFGAYTLAIQPSVATVTVGGNCFEPDSIPNITVVQDSFSTLNITVLTPRVEFNHSSVNIVAPNHGSSSEPVHIGNTGDGQLYYTLVPQTLNPRGTWLSVSPASGVVNPGEATDVLVTVSADTSNIGVFDFFGNLTLHVNSCPDSVFYVTVNATIVNDVEGDLNELPEALALAAYPNPFNPTTTLSFTMPQFGLVDLEIFDIQGRSIRTLLQREFSAGKHSVTVDASSLTSGVYFAKLVTPNGTATTKLLLLK